MTNGIKQNNKKHRDSSKALKVSNKASAKPKTDAVKNLQKKGIFNDSKDLRVLQAQQRKQISQMKNANSDYTQRGNNNSAPLLCGIFPLFDFNDIDVILSLLKSTDPDAKIIQSEDLGDFKKLHSHNFVMNSKKFRKNFSFTSCRNFRDRFDYLDLAKVVDWALFVLPNDFDELVGDYTDDLITALIAQGLPSSCFCIVSDVGIKMKALEKSFESITKLNLGDSKISSLTNQNDANKLMRHMAQNCRGSFISTKKNDDMSKSIQRKKGYFIAENMKYDVSADILTVHGCMRGYGMHLGEQLCVHLTEVGDFNVKEMSWMTPEESNKRVSGSPINKWIAQEITECKNSNADEIQNDDMNDDDSEGNESNDESDEDSMSEEVSDIGSDDSDDDKDEKMSYASTANTGYSLAQIQKFRESREDSMFPDEIEVGCNENAREKLNKYRGLKGFKSTEWPTDINIPECHANILEIKKYKHDRNRMYKNIISMDRTSANEFVRAGSKFEMVLDKFTEESRVKLNEILRQNPMRHVICSNLFASENRVGMLHFNERRLSTVDDSAVAELAKCNNNNDHTIELGEEFSSGQMLDPAIVLAPKAEPIESKETMLYQVGFRRFTATPIYSECNADSDQIGSKGKAKYCKFMEAKRNVVATLYGPITFGPVSVLQFRLRQKDLGFEEVGPPYVAELVATGSMMSIDSSRPIIKRILLSGEIFKVNKRSVMVRYMFFNVEDIEHFKEVPLHTKSGRKGRIVKTSGTHGYMKCCFDKPLSQQEVVLMPLYKRIFPKYTVQSMFDQIPDMEQVENDNMDAMDTMF